MSPRARRQDYEHDRRVASDSSQTLISNYPSDEQIAISKGDFFELFESDGFNPEGEEVDMLAEVRRYVNLLQVKPFGEFVEEDRHKPAMFKAAMEHIYQKNNWSDGT